MRRSLVALALLALSSNAHAKTLRVPEQYPTIQDAVEAMHSGDVLRIGPGRFLSFAILVQLDHVTIRGAGKTKTTLSASPGLILSQAILLSQCSNVTIADLSIEGSSDYAIGGSSVRNLVIRNCRVREVDGKRPGPISLYHCDGVHVTRTDMIGQKSRMEFGFAGEETTGEVVISRCRFVDVANRALAIAGGDVTIDRNRFLRCTADAIFVSAGDLIGPVQVRRNSLVDTTDNAIDVNGPHFVTIEGNRIRKCFAPILTTGAIEARLLNNDIADAADALDCPGAGTIIAGNRFVRSGSSALKVKGKASIVARNVIVDCGSTGIEIGGAGVRLRDNRVFGAQSEGISTVSTATGLDARGNRVAKTSGNGIALAGNDCTLRDNRVKNAGAHGFEILSLGNQLAANAAHGSTMSDLHCDLQTNTIAGNNHFGTVEDIP